MQQTEMADILNAVQKLPLADMDVVDQMYALMAINELCEKMKPLIVKYAGNLPKKTSFIVKM